MPAVKQIICLACSRKRSGLCIAGKERLGDGSLAWVRPVSDRPDEEISEQECRFSGGNRVRLLDVIDVSLVGHRPRGVQTENWLLQPRKRWTLCSKRAEYQHLLRLADDPKQLWDNGMSTSEGLNDRVPAADTDDLAGSLFLIHVDDLSLKVSVPSAAFGSIEPRVQGAFSWHGVGYRLRVTDTEIEADFLLRQDGTYPIGECYATVSLSLPYKGYCYKLVAGIFRPPAADR